MELVQASSFGAVQFFCNKKCGVSFFSSRGPQYQHVPGAEVGVYIQSGRSMDTDVEKVVTPVAKKQNVNICGYAPLAAYQYEPNRACDAF